MRRTLGLVVLALIAAWCGPVGLAASTITTTGSWLPYSYDRAMPNAQVAQAGIGVASARIGPPERPRRLSKTRSPGFLAAKALPKGFASAEDFAGFGSSLRSGLRNAGYDDVTAYLQGSAVTGKSFRTGQAFDVGRVSDFDVALESSSLLSRASELGIPLRSAGARTGPLSARDLQRLGLRGLAQDLSAGAGRPVNFMIYGPSGSAAARAPSVLVP